MGVDDGGSIGVAIAILHQDLIPETRVPKAFPRHYLVPRDIGFIIQQAGGSPHIRNHVVGSLTARLTQLIQFLLDIGRDIVDIIRSLPEITVDRQQEVLPQHTLDDILRGTDQVEILMPPFDLGQHDLVDIKDLIDNPDLLTRLFLIPFREIRQDVLVDIISPVINLQDLASLLVRAPARSEQPHKQGQNRQNRYKFLHFHLRSLRFLSTFIYNNQQY